MSTWTPSEIAMTVCFIAATVIVSWIVMTIILSRTYLAGRRDGLREGQVIGELSEHRRRDEANVRARREADERFIAEAMGSHRYDEITQEELDV